jgi:hypothetical protein
MAGEDHGAHELLKEVATTATSLAAKVQSSVLETRPDDARGFAEALHDACTAYQRIFDCCAQAADDDHLSA